MCTVDCLLVACCAYHSATKHNTTAMPPPVVQNQGSTTTLPIVQILKSRVCLIYAGKTVYYFPPNHFILSLYSHTVSFHFSNLFLSLSLLNRKGNEKVTNNQLKKLLATMLWITNTHTRTYNKNVPNLNL